MSVDNSLWIQIDVAAIIVTPTFHLWLHYDKVFALVARVWNILGALTHPTNRVNILTDLVACVQNIYRAPADGCALHLRKEKDKLMVIHFQSLVDTGGHLLTVVVVMVFLGSLLNQDFGPHDLAGCMFMLTLYLASQSFAYFELTVTPQRIYIFYYVFMAMLLCQMCFFGGEVYWLVLNSSLAVLRIVLGLLVSNSGASLPCNLAISITTCCKSIRASYPSGFVAGFVLQELITVVGISAVLFFNEKWLEERIQATENVASSLRAVTKLLAVAFDAEICFGGDLRIVDPTQQAIHLLRSSSLAPGEASTDIANVDFMRFVTEPSQKSFLEFVNQQGSLGHDNNAIISPPLAFRLQLQDMSGYCFDVDLLHVQTAVSSNDTIHLLGIRECEPHKRAMPNAPESSSSSNNMCKPPFKSAPVNSSLQDLSSLAVTAPKFPAKVKPGVQVTDFHSDSYCYWGRESDADDMSCSNSSSVPSEVMHRFTAPGGIAAVQAAKTPSVHCSTSNTDNGLDSALQMPQSVG